jgi:transposase
MANILTEPERTRLRGFIRRPRSRKQLYRAEALIALDDGQPIEAVARKFRVGIDRVEAWLAGFEEKRLAYLAEPDGSRPRDDHPDEPNDDADEV